MNESDLDLTLFKKQLDEQIVETGKYIDEIRNRYQSQVVTPDRFGIDTGPFHTASILSWCRIAQLADIPYIPAESVADIPMDDVYASVDNKTLSSKGEEEYRKAQAYVNKGGFWRTDLCANEEVKYVLGTGKPLPPVITFHCDDCRIIDMNAFMPSITIVGRPRVTPRYVGNFPVEFRVFIGGKVDPSGAVSFYYPQAEEFEVTPDLIEAMDTAFIYAVRIHQQRLELGLTPWLPEQGDPNEAIGSTIDFMMLQNGGVVMVDAGPGFGYGAHPCCFLDLPVEGKRWRPKEGIDIR